MFGKQQKHTHQPQMNKQKVINLLSSTFSLLTENSPLITEDNLFSVTRNVEEALSEVSGGTPPGKPTVYYYALCMSQTLQGAGLVEMYLDEHPLVWVGRKRGEMEIAGIRGAIVVQFFSEIPADIYHEAKGREKMVVG